MKRPNWVNRVLVWAELCVVSLNHTISNSKIFSHFKRTFSTIFCCSPRNFSILREVLYNFFPINLFEPGIKRPFFFSS
jgi:hypothetical protein